MYLAAKDHCDDSGANGLRGHLGSDASSPSERMKKYSTYFSWNAENIQYNREDAVSIIMKLFVDDGVTNRGNRNNLISINYLKTATAHCNHATYNNVAVIVYAKDFCANQFAKDKLVMLGGQGRGRMIHNAH